MGAALVGLGGVVIGVLGTVLVTLLAAKASERQTQATRAEERRDKSRELAAPAYVSAVEAVAWLSSMHVEDSVDPHFMPEYEPKTKRATEALLSARLDLTRVSALGGDQQLASVVPDVIVALGTLGDAWEGAQEARRDIVSGRRTVLDNPNSDKTWAETKFDLEYERLNAARQRLCGRAADLPSTETDEGLVLADSLLGRLRAATALM